MEVQEIETWIPYRQEAITDFSLCWACLFIRDESPLTATEKRSGYRHYKCREGHVGRYAVGWRREKLDREYEAKREAEMAACPYVECTCGHHEE